MGIDLSRVSDFLAGYGRVLDRRRFGQVIGEGDTEAMLAALEGYRNADGGYGWGLEPDLRSGESQTGAALHAFEVFAEVAPVTSGRAVELCDWLGEATLADGGVPFALPVGSAVGCAPFWADADASVSSLQISAIVAENAHRVAAHDPAVAGHPWLGRITEYCLGAIGRLEGRPFAMELAFAVRFLDAAHGAYPEAGGLVDRLREWVPEDGLVRVLGGAEDEFMRPLDFAPFPGGPARGLLAPGVIEADLERLAEGQQEDGGWQVDFASYSPAAALEWRGYATVRAVSILRANGRL